MPKSRTGKLFTSILTYMTQSYYTVRNIIYLNLRYLRSSGLTINRPR